MHVHPRHGRQDHEPDPDAEDHGHQALVRRDRLANRSSFVQRQHGVKPDLFEKVQEAPAEEPHQQRQQEAGNKFEGEQLGDISARKQRQVRPQHFESLGIGQQESHHQKDEDPLPADRNCPLGAQRRQRPHRPVGIHPVDHDE